MATWDDVARLCAALPGTDQLTSRDGNRQWRVADKLFVWERPLRSKDLAELGDAVHPARCSPRGCPTRVRSSR